jgi:hypothetical protein
MSAHSRVRIRAVLVALTPPALAAALLAHPHLPGRLPNPQAIAEAVLADPSRWAAAHLAAAVASGLVAVAFVLVARHLREAGEATWSGFGLPFVVLGSVLYATLPGMEFAPWAAAETGGDVVGAQVAIGSWFLPTLLASALSFGIGAVAFAGSVTRSGVLGPGMARWVAAALVVMALSRAVPYVAVQFHVQSAAALAALWPLAFVMWREGKPASAPAPDAAPTPRSAAAGAHLHPEEARR